MKVTLPSWHAKFVLAACGVLGFYLGGIAAIYFLSGGGARATGGWGAVVATAVGGLGASFLALWGCDAALGDSASHVDVLKVLFYLACAALGLYLVDAALLKLIDRSLPSFVETFALWSAAVYGVWIDEPGGVNWRTLAAALKDLRRR